MSASTQHWSGLDPLPQGRTLLLEASAGTGKTWQIASLVTRLVAEEGVLIERILVITFTNAATAELRHRVRRRLLEARDALRKALAADAAQPDTGAPGQGVAPGAGWVPADPVLAALCAPTQHRSERERRLAEALAGFDQAFISTIHGFSQRMLEQLAFASGQEPGLELLGDEGPILEELAADELAGVYARASEQDLAVLDDMGFGPAGLATLGATMKGAVAPLLDPPCPADDPVSSDPLAAVERWRARLQSFASWWQEPAGGQAAKAALAKEYAAKRARFNRNRLRAGSLLEPLGHLPEWLDACGVLPPGPAREAITKLLSKATVASLTAAWSASAGPVEQFEAWPLFERLDELQQERRRLWPLARSAYAARARAHLDGELRRRGLLTYNAMLARLAERIGAEGPCGPLATAIRSQFDVALVDEFQDTDGAQWPVLDAAFGAAGLAAGAAPDRRLLLIGDPKQAIYRFRGADLHVYLAAAATAQQRHTMAKNWRSDHTYVQALNHLWVAGSDAFELQGVDYVHIAEVQHAEQRLRSLPAAAAGRPTTPLELRWVDGETLGADDNLHLGSKERGEDACARLCAAEAARLLSAGTELQVAAAADGEPATWRELHPGDIAVLVRTNAQGTRVRDELRALGIPAVASGRDSVLTSPVVDWLCRWLEAVAQPGRDGPARLLATTPLFGWTGATLARSLEVASGRAPATADVPDWAAWLEAVSRWTERWTTQGFVRVFEGALQVHGVLPRLLGAPDGQRLATDLRHLVELCHTEQQRARLSPAGLAAWLLAQRRGAAGSAAGDDVGAQRLESDARAVQVVTVFKSKGLEYPVVLLPFAWAERGLSDSGQPLLWHPPGASSPRPTLNLHPQGAAGREEAASALAREGRQEKMRLLYVALTRAAHHSVAWLGPIGRHNIELLSSALGRLALRERDSSGAVLAEGAGVTIPALTGRKESTLAKQRDAQQGGRQECWRRLDLLCSTSAGGIGWRAEAQLTERSPVHLPARAVESPCAQAWPGARGLRTPWQVASYSSLVAGRTVDGDEPSRREESLLAAAAGVGEAELVSEGAELDEELPATSEPRAHGRSALLDVAPALGAMAGGTEVGTWAHAVLEHLDFASGDARDGRPAATLVAEQGRRLGVSDPAQHELLLTALPVVLATPLDTPHNRLPPGWSLAKLPEADRIDELPFDLRLGAGSRWQRSPGRDRTIDPSAVRAALDPLRARRGWAGAPWLDAVLSRRRRDGSLAAALPAIAGVLTGFVDLVFRVPLPEGGHRYYLSDYKTNRIRPRLQRAESRLEHYTPPWLAWEMARHGYHLQALLYTVALHRLLRQRLGTAYDYEAHVGGHLYLFVRGMQGEGGLRVDGAPLGVWSDRWPAEVVLELDAALDGAPAPSRGGAP